MKPIFNPALKPSPNNSTLEAADKHLCLVVQHAFTKGEPPNVGRSGCKGALFCKECSFAGMRAIFAHFTRVTPCPVGCLDLLAVIGMLKKAIKNLKCYYNYFSKIVVPAFPACPPTKLS